MLLSIGLSYGFSQSNKLFSATRIKVTSVYLKKTLVSNVLHSDCFLKHERFRLIEIYFSNGSKDSSNMNVRCSILGDFKTDYKYYGYFILNDAIFLVKGNIPANIFIKTKFVQKFPLLQDRECESIYKYPVWYFVYNDNKFTFIRNECDN